MAIKCCYKCPDRWVKDGKTCHSTCERYAREKAQWEIEKEQIKANRAKTPNITPYDFDEIAYVSCKRHKRRNRD